MSAGNMDSIVNRFTSSRRLRNKDAYSPVERWDLSGSSNDSII